MNSKISYLIVQLTILFTPAIWAANRYAVNDYISSPFSEYLFYIMGVSGTFLVGIPVDIVDMFLPESIAATIGIVGITSVAIYLYLFFYEPKIKRIAIVTLINTYLSLWSVLWGNIIMFLAMQ